MSKMSELSLVIDEMIACGEGMIKAATQLKEIFSSENLQEPKTPTKLTEETPAKDNRVSAKSYTKEDVRGLLASKSSAGYGKEVRILLSKYGADKLSTLDPAHYAAVIAEAEVIGNA